MVTLAGVIGYGIFAYVSSAAAHTAAYDLLYEIRIRLMEKMSRISAGYFTNVTQGAVKKVMSDDVEELEGFVAHSLCEVSAAIATPVFTVAYLFFMDWKLALVTLLPILLSFLLLGMCLKQKDKAAMQKEMHDNLERMTGTIVEYIHGMPVVKVFHRSLGAFRRYETDIDRFVDSVEKTAKANAAPMGLYYVTFGAQLLFLLPACIFKITHADSYINCILVVILFLLIGQGLKEPLENMMTMTVMLNRVTESVSRVDQILNQPEIISNGTRDPKRFDVSFEDVTSEIFEYVEGMQTLKAFNVAGEYFTSLKNAFQKQRESAIHIETDGGAGECLWKGGLKPWDRTCHTAWRIPYRRVRDAVVFLYCIFSDGVKCV